MLCVVAVIITSKGIVCGVYLSPGVEIKFDLQAEEEKINREKQRDQEERMAKELARINHEKQREEKMRQHIKENRCTPQYLNSLYVLGSYTNATHIQCFV